MVQTAEEIRREKLEYLRLEQALTSDPLKRFELSKRIEELEHEFLGSAGWTADPFCISRLPVPGEYFLGREAELLQLDEAFADDATRIFVLVAFGGVGKSALVYNWLEALADNDWRGAERVLGWSFYSQGTDAAAANADAFVDFALGWLGHRGEIPNSP